MAAQLDCTVLASVLQTEMPSRTLIFGVLGGAVCRDT